MHELFSIQSSEMVGDGRLERVWNELRDRGAWEHVADHRCWFQNGALLTGKIVQTCSQKRLDRGRDGQLREVARGHPGLAVALEHPFVNEHRNELTHKEGVSLCRPDDPIAHYGRYVPA